MSALLRENYGIEAIEFQQLRSVTGVIDTLGRKYIWKTARSAEAVTRLSVLNGLVQVLQNNGIAAARAIPTYSGALACSLETREQTHQFGYLQPWLPGRHVNLAERAERLTAIRVVSSMHRLTERRIGPFLSVPASPEGWGTGWGTVRPPLLLLRMEQKFRLLSTHWSDITLLFPSFQAQKEALFRRCTDAISSVDMKSFDPTTFGDGTRTLSWCHRDLAPHNLLWNGESVALIDFDLAAVDDPLGDVAQICNHALNLDAVGEEEWTEMAEFYAESVHLQPARKRRLWSLLCFPDTLARAVTDWVRQGRPRDANALQHAIRCEEKRMKWTQGIIGGTLES